MAEKTKSSTKGVIDIAAMGKAGAATGLKTEAEESFIPNALKQIGGFALNQYFRSVQLTKSAINQVKTSFGEVILKEHIQGNTNALERVRKLQSEMIEAQKYINHPVHMLTPWTEEYKKHEETINRVNLSVSDMDAGIKQFADAKSDDLRVISGDVDERGNAIFFSGNSTESQKLLSTLRANGDIDRAMVFLPDPDNDGIDARYVNIAQIDWDGDDIIDSDDREIGRANFEIENLGVSWVDGEGRDRYTSDLVKYDDLINNDMFASYSFSNVNSDMFDKYNKAVINAGYNLFDMESELSKDANANLRSELNEIKDTGIKDMFFRVEVDGRTFAQKYVEDTTIEILKKELSEEDIAKLPTTEDVELMKAGILELLKTSANRGEEGDFTIEEMKGIIMEISEDRAGDKNAGAISEAEIRKETAESEARSKSRRSSKLMSYTAAKNLIRTSVHGDRWQHPKTGTWYEKEVNVNSGEVTWIGTFGTKTYIYNEGEFYHQITGDQAKNVKPRI